MKKRTRRMSQFFWSLTGFVLLLAVLVAVDERVHDTFTRLMWADDGIASWDNQAMRMWSTATAGLRYTSIENGPFLAFAVVGAVLFVFMVRT